MKSPNQIQDQINACLQEKLDDLVLRTDNIEYLRIMPYSTINVKRSESSSVESENSFRGKMKKMQPKLFPSKK